MIGSFGTNIDDVRARIMELESAPVFDQRAWAQVLIALAGSPCRRADAARRMETAKQNSQGCGGVDIGCADGDKTTVCVIARFKDYFGRWEKLPEVVVNVSALTASKARYQIYLQARGAYPEIKITEINVRRGQFVVRPLNWDEYVRPSKGVSAETAEL